MHFRHTMGLILLFFAVTANAYELLTIQAVSDSKKSFITRSGKRQGIMVGMTATFTAEDVAVLAKATKVTGEFTVWELTNQEAVLPFEKGTLVTYNAATEYLWALTPESERKKFIKSERPEPRQSWVFKGAFTRGLSESVSDAPAAKSQRGGYLGEIYYERDIIPGLAFDVGARYEREVVNYPNASLLTTRNLVITDIIYYIDVPKDIMNGRIYMGAGMGYGLSHTTAVGLAQSGSVSLLPAVKLGVSLPFDHQWEFLSDAAFESLQTSEKQQDGTKQTTTQTNFKFAFGIRHYL